MTYAIFTDPHIGTSRAAHTSRSSSEKLKKRLFDEAYKIASLPNSICVGDLFDSSKNNEEAMLQGFKVASKCKYLLAGNHDEDNVTGRTTTLRALKAIGVESIVASPSLSEPYYFNDGGLYFVPHHISQKLFNEAIEQAFDSVDGKAVLFIHCNYNCEFTDSDATLNISEAQVEKLLTKFSFIFMGHEHGHKILHDGKLVVVGNTFPTSYSDISSKYYVELEEDFSSYRVVKTFDVDTGLLILDINKEVNEQAVKNASFIEVIGLTKSSSDFVKFQDYLWSINDEIYAIRNKTVNEVEIQVTKKVEASSKLSLEDSLLSDTPELLKPLLIKLLAEVK